MNLSNHEEQIKEGEFTPQELTVMAARFAELSRRVLVRRNVESKGRKLNLLLLPRCLRESGKEILLCVSLRC